jgi:hypothetical protein
MRVPYSPLQATIHINVVVFHSPVVTTAKEHALLLETVAMASMLRDSYCTIFKLYNFPQRHRGLALRSLTKVKAKFKQHAMKT